ncbi:Clp protease N-terminal domain-containing protein [Actinokineospora terrae]|uniref:Clp amino terminal domain-containing protein, pathogenicity island component n=1 Tax=Actinokineospora terrae TaxID=155974 RepID=A0A1H9WSD9_9PSEU|nr:Clp protease N-terminal domain-containing protein [Actinokineospora terrae]SES36597.1 Clp amino terminal domain-containing protein, pathogenicity island component [Actinokineospora terrae]
MVEGFEGFTADAQRVIALAEAEAGRSHHDYLGSVHLLLGLARGPGHASRVLVGEKLGPDVLRARAESHVRRGVSTGRAPLRVAAEVRRVVEHAREEAAELGRPLVDTEHLLLGLLSEPNCVAAQMLHSLGADRFDLRQRVMAALTPTPRPTGNRPVDRYTEAVPPAPALGRDAEIDQVVRILGHRTGGVVLHGPAGIGKSAVVRGVVHRISTGKVVRALANRPVRVLRASLVTDVRELVEELLQLHCVLWVPVPSPQASAVLTLAKQLGVRVIVTTDDLLKLPEDSPRETVELAPLTVDATVQVLATLRPDLQTHYAITITDDALVAAAESAPTPLPGAAIDLLEHLCSRATDSVLTADHVRPTRTAPTDFDTDMWSLG